MPKSGLQSNAMLLLHGGLSTGPRTPEGKAACVAAHEICTELIKFLEQENMDKAD